MTPRELMTQRRAPLRLLIFDCDGVIVDSEPISNRILAEDFSARGWAMTGDEAEHLFIGTTLAEIQPRAEARLGHKLPDDWRATLRARIVDAMLHEAIPVPGAVPALHGVSALGLPWRVASNSSHEELRAKFARLELTELMAGRVHSHHDVPRPKPAPDLFLAAAAAEGVAPAECLVVEDSVAGATGAQAAGMDCLGLDRHGDGAALRAVGAVPFHDMAELPGLVALALERPK
jgi:HAD superfamily hydrolase (TIGR01509 family)